MNNCCDFCGDDFEQGQEIIKYRGMCFCEEDCLFGEISTEISRLIYEKEEDEEEI